MSKFLKIALAVALAAVVYVERVPMRQSLGHVCGALQSTTNDFTGSTAVDLGQMAKRQLVQNTLRNAIAGYRSLHGEEPASLSDLVAEGLLQRADLVDEWGRPLQVDCGVNRLVIRSAGVDGLAGTPDDWVFSR